MTIENKNKAIEHSDMITLSLNGRERIVVGIPFIAAVISLTFLIGAIAQITSMVFNTRTIANAQLDTIVDQSDMTQLRVDHQEIRREHAEVLRDHDQLLGGVRDNEELLRNIQTKVDLNATAAIGVLSGNAVMSGWLLKVLRK